MPKVTWTGNNLAAVKKVYARVRHYPENPKKPHYRDWTQHPDNLHVDLEGYMASGGLLAKGQKFAYSVILEVGDSLAKDAKGNVTIVKAKTPRAPRALRPPMPSTGTVHHAFGEN